MCFFFLFEYSNMINLLDWLNLDVMCLSCALAPGPLWILPSTEFLAKRSITLDWLSAMNVIDRCAHTIFLTFTVHKTINAAFSALRHHIEFIIEITCHFGKVKSKPKPIRVRRFEVLRWYWLTDHIDERLPLASHTYSKLLQLHKRMLIKLLLHIRWTHATCSR